MRFANLIAKNELPAEAEIILRRTITADGRTRAFVNDEPVGVALLRDLGSMIVEIHGQADDRGLFDSATHRRLLDAFGGHERLPPKRENGSRTSNANARKRPLKRARKQVRPTPIICAMRSRNCPNWAPSPARKRVSRPNVR
jgi:DNA repair ATPase RecN